MPKCDKKESKFKFMLCAVCAGPLGDTPVADANGLLACAECADGIAEEHSTKGKLDA